ncbi:MAG: nitroreductase/quinone reductase family protein [Chloroflexota bacterium]
MSQRSTIIMTIQSKPVERPLASPFVANVMNPLIAALLRSPLHGALSGSTIVLSFKGRKSGKVYNLPVGYYELQGDRLVVIPLHRWWKNLQGNVPVTVWLKGRKYTGVANATQGDEVTISVLQQIIANSANLMRVYKIERDANGQPDANAIQHVAQSLALVRIRLTTT